MKSQLLETEIADITNIAQLRGEAWTESEWFQEWLQLAKGEHPSQASEQGQIQAEAA